jgi:hypothetical protein
MKSGNISSRDWPCANPLALETRLAVERLGSPASYLGDPCSNLADHSGRAVYGMNCLRSPERWDRGFESYSRHGYLAAFILCLCCSV